MNDVLLLNRHTLFVATAVLVVLLALWVEALLLRQRRAALLADLRADSQAQTQAQTQAQALASAPSPSGSAP